MRAVVHDRRPLELFRLEEIERPTPKEDGGIVRVHAASRIPCDFAQISHRQ